MIANHHQSSDPGTAAARVEALIAARPRAAQIRLLCDTRPMHRLLVRLSAGDRQPKAAAGRYRREGQEVVILGALGGRPCAVRGSPSGRVTVEMARWSARTEGLLTRPPADPAQRRHGLSAAFGTLLCIHPYADGNGRVARILFQRGCDLLDVPLGAQWRLDERCYGRGLGLAAECSLKSARPITAYMERFYG